MEFQLFSDIHLELMSPAVPKITPLAKVLILAGDIGKMGLPNFKEFFDYCSKNWATTIYVPGNHEYYNSSKTYVKLKSSYREFFESYDNVHFLDNGLIEMDNIVIVGSTLWSIPVSTENLSDFKQIKEFNEATNRTTGISLSTFKQLHCDAKNYIIEQIAAAPTTKKVLVVTHFPPTSWKTSAPKYPTNPYFATDILDEISKDKISAWLFGHTHHSCDIITPTGIRLIANQVGYISELGETGFSEDGLITIV